MTADLLVAYCAVMAAAGIVGYFHGWEDGREYERRKTTIPPPVPVRIFHGVNIREFRKRIEK